MENAIPKERTSNGIPVLLSWIYLLYTENSKITSVVLLMKYNTLCQFRLVGDILLCKTSSLVT